VYLLFKTSHIFQGHLFHLDACRAVVDPGRHPGAFLRAGAALELPSELVMSDISDTA
jgi:hypothetical protein